MKKILSLIALALFAFGCATQSPKGYSIKGATNTFDGQIYLQVLEGKNPVTIDSTTVKDGVYHFRGSVEMPIAAQIVDSDGKSLFLFYLENSDIEIVNDSAATPVLSVVGSSEDSLYREFLVAMDSVKTENGYNTTTSNFVNKYPKSIAASYVLFRLMSPRLDAEQLREHYYKFDTSIRSNVYLKKVIEKADLLDKTAVGTKFTDFELPNENGEMVKLSDIAGKGNWVLVDFWASWCAPCRKENPNVVKAFDMFKNKGFTVFGVSLDKNKEAWVEAIAKDGLNWTNVSDLKFWECVPAQIYGVSSIPSNVMIAPDGVIAARNLKGEDLIKFLNEKIK